jgi:hypothetical protein
MSLADERIGQMESGMYFGESVLRVLKLIFAGASQTGDWDIPQRFETFRRRRHLKGHI